MLRFTILLISVLAPLTISKSIKKPKCEVICDIYCEYGHVLDEKGCPTCTCKPSPCENGQAPLSGYFCGRGPTHQDCPSNSTCFIAPNDSYAVCCPSNEQSATEQVTTTIKSGSCPPLFDEPDIFIVRCKTDIDCEGNFKCCGDYSRQCVKRYT
ncbi:unnamed protein product [Rotaria sp. Silwood2]|nr:unnamed protein product [Rotaria sp. Silwood2]CAF2571954.1 unnamed protein product [Rotaria sp. Silwood2]CAF2732828.1 unnamed protein product [Rotaria sp. Silwood2]CAF2965119.1 unnamed protein product [Rotaria sp. Silwood2]CAF3867593.1 unnamed protein product [Rotaria sp. Silwood2]